MPDLVEVSIDGSRVSVKGPSGELHRLFDYRLTIIEENRVLRVERHDETDQMRSLHGLTRSLLANMITGVTTGFQRSLELVGTGYRAQQRGNGISLSVGYSHTVDIDPMDGITLQVEGQNRVHVKGINKESVGEQAARIRSTRKPNAYTGKGVRYVGEIVRVKPGKRAVGTGI